MRTLINVDIQPEYEQYINSFTIPRWINFLNKINLKMKIIFLYNGKETLDMISEDKYKEWLLENGVSDEVIDNAIFYDKGYAFFRYCMDESIDEDTIANFVRFMYENHIHDSRNMDRDMWAKYLRQYRRIDKKEVYELFDRAEDCIHIPDLMDFLKNYNGIVLTGGGISQCLKEVEIALKALKKDYTILREFTY